MIASVNISAHLLHTSQVVSSKHGVHPKSTADLLYVNINIIASRRVCLITKSSVGQTGVSQVISYLKLDRLSAGAGGAVNVHDHQLHHNDHNHILRKASHDHEDTHIISLSRV